MLQLWSEDKDMFTLNNLTTQVHVRSLKSLYAHAIKNFIYADPTLNLDYLIHGLLATYYTKACLDKFNKAYLRIGGIEIVFSFYIKESKDDKNSIRSV